ncbi:adenylyl-sulfate kinase [Haloarcula sp. CGMCC 1.2071]|uniref:adenylyl-sulfate kinase n=1 Tax=Haloarcula sp. CGMCC 1.2071 TaxID=3111454 RepID=UPI00300F62EB
MFTLWFMGRPASGKSTLASAVEDRLRERGLPMENLDGDDLRKNLHPDLGFSREDRRLNNKRTAYICKLLNRSGIPVIVGMITPFRESQQQAREIIEPEGDFVLVHTKCSLEECERRDPKNLYQRARKGKIEKFTGVNHPFQEPHDPDIVVNTEDRSLTECVEHVLSRLDELAVVDEQLSDQYNFHISKSEEKTIKDKLSKKGFLDT